MRSADINNSVVDLRINTDDVAGVREDVDGVVAWRVKLANEPGCYGRVRRGSYFIWRGLLQIEPIWRIVITVGVACGAMFASFKASEDAEVSLFRGICAGLLTGMVLLLLWRMTFDSGVFMDQNTYRHYREDQHCTVIVVYFILLLLVVLVSLFIYKVDTQCAKQTGPCDIKHIFI